MRDWNIWKLVSHLLPEDESVVSQSSYKDFACSRIHLQDVWIAMFSTKWEEIIKVRKNAKPKVVERETCQEERLEGSNWPSLQEEGERKKRFFMTRFSDFQSHKKHPVWLILFFPLSFLSSSFLSPFSPSFFFLSLSWKTKKVFRMSTTRQLIFYFLHFSSGRSLKDEEESSEVVVRGEKSRADTFISQVFKRYKILESLIYDVTSWLSFCWKNSYSGSQEVKVFFTSSLLLPSSLSYFFSPSFHFLPFLLIIVIPSFHSSPSSIFTLTFRVYDVGTKNNYKRWNDLRAHVSFLSFSSFFSHLFLIPFFFLFFSLPLCLSHFCCNFHEILVIHYLKIMLFPPYIKRSLSLSPPSLSLSPFLPLSLSFPFPLPTLISFFRLQDHNQGYMGRGLMVFLRISE